MSFLARSQLVIRKFVRAYSTADLYTATGSARSDPYAHLSTKYRHRDRALYVHDLCAFTGHLRPCRDCARSFPYCAGAYLRSSFIVISSTIAGETWLQFFYVSTFTVLFVSASALACIVPFDHMHWQSGAAATPSSSAGFLFTFDPHSSGECQIYTAREYYTVISSGTHFLPRLQSAPGQQ